MRAQDVIRKKRDGEQLDREEIEFLISVLSSGSIPDYQLSAFLMAVFLRGMTDQETVWLTEAMMRSGNIIDFSGVNKPKVDKHSTGGVGDKTSIILAPLLASTGIAVPMVSGRGLGHTGGTLDKLESIPGLRTDLTVEEFVGNVKELGLGMIGQTDDIAPADRKLYALRDVTATVECIPLIASSIMSKKLSEGLDGLVLDVKCGTGAFMKTIGEAMELAATLVRIGDSMGIRVVALITNMDQPIGKTVGNALEVKECISALRGKWEDDLRDLTLTLASWMLNLGDCVSEDEKVGKMSKFVLGKYMKELLEYIDKGDAYKKFAELVDVQHGDPEAVFNLAMLPKAAITKEITAERDGYIGRLDAGAVGTASMLLGAGREKAEDDVDPAAGIVLNRKIGDKVNKGEPIAIFHLNADGRFDDAREAFMRGLEIRDRAPAVKPMILKTVLKEDVSPQAPPT